MTKDPGQKKPPGLPLHLQAAQGSEEALSTLYRDNADALFAFVLYRVGGNVSLTEDIVQETFLWALDHLTRFRPELGTFLSWLCTSSRNIIRKHLRDSRRGQELQRVWDQIDQALLQIYTSLEKTPLSDEILERKETQALVQASIAQLPKQYRNILAIHYIDGTALKEVGALLSISEEAAKSLLARARRAFRETFTTLANQLSEVKP
jgi:RNA polymerase sigma-70 factor (ECF subfamily)